MQVECVADNGVPEAAKASARLEIYPDGKSKSTPFRQSPLEIIRFLGMTLVASTVDCSVYRHGGLFHDRLTNFCSSLLNVN